VCVAQRRVPRVCLDVRWPRASCAVGGRRRSRAASSSRCRATSLTRTR
jgi:hypothetical protein